MGRANHLIDHRNLYALSWHYAQDGMFAFDSENGILLDANPAAEALMGYSREELIGMHVTMLHPEDERPRVALAFRAVAQRPSRHEGFSIQRKDGTPVPVLITSSKSEQTDDGSVLICVFRDITEEREKENLLSAQNWALSAFSIAALALGRAQTAEGLLQSICDAIVRESVYVLASIGIAEDGPGREIRIAASAGSALKYMDGLRLSWSEDDPRGRGPMGTAVRLNELQILDDTETSEAFVPWRERANEFGMRSCIAIPLRTEGSWHGVLTVYSVRPNAFQSSSVEVFERLGEQIVHGIHALEQKRLLDAERLHLEKTQRHLTEALTASVSAMVTAMEMRDPYTAGHESRVAEIAYAIGKEMGWPESRLQGLRMAAMVHDIGKISIPAEILTKPGKLSTQEFALIKGHPDTGHAILRDIPFTWPIADIVRQHHEKLNGSGYPLGLKDGEILDDAKVLAVADIVEAMASDRPYRTAIPLDIVLREIESQAGKLLDPAVVAVCLSLFREKNFQLPGFNGQ